MVDRGAGVRFRFVKYGIFVFLYQNGGADEDENVDVEGDVETFEEYEWAGQKRIRASTLLQGGYAGNARGPWGNDKRAHATSILRATETLARARGYRRCGCWPLRPACPFPELQSSLFWAREYCCCLYKRDRD